MDGENTDVSSRGTCDSTREKLAASGRELSVLSGRFAICRLRAGESPPAPPAGVRFWSLTAEPGEMTLVCAEESAPSVQEIEPGWRGLVVEGEIPFTEVGVLAELTASLAPASVSVYAVSTFRTDYLFVRDVDLGKACTALEGAGYVLRAEENTSGENTTGGSR